MPLTFESMAFCTSVACWPESGLFEYFSWTPVFFAACSAPERILSQNESPGASWVIIAMVRFWPLPPPPPPPAGAGWFCAPPWLLHAASAADAATTAARTRSDLREPLIFIDLSLLRAAGQEADCGVLRGTGGPFG